MLRLIQISDTHLSPAKPHFAANWAPLAAWIADERPDLVIHTGDVSIDGADSDDDLRHCAGLMRRLGVPFRAVPGNHDVGDSRHRHRPVDARRLLRWRRHFGADRWVEDVEGWRLIGIDALLFGSGGPEEHEQLAWLEDSMNDAEGRRLAWFLTGRCFSTAPTKATPVIGRCRPNRGARCSRSCAATAWRWWRAVICKLTRIFLCPKIAAEAGQRVNQ
jgi:3',5'-cyclic AMP phosphodiesterase CpdA